MRLTFFLQKKFLYAIIAAVLFAIFSFVYFRPHIEGSEYQLQNLIAIEKSVYNGTYIEIKIKLVENTTIHPYGIEGVNVYYHYEWGPSTMKCGDSLTLFIPYEGTINGTVLLKFLLLCDEGKIPFEIELKEEK